MSDKALTYAIAAALIFCALAIIFAGVGGLVDSEKHRSMLAAGSGFWLLMLIVPWTVVSPRQNSVLTEQGVVMAIGAVVGLCYSLCFDPGHGLMRLIEAMAMGAAVGLMAFWGSWLRWRRWR